MNTDFSADATQVPFEMGGMPHKADEMQEHSSDGRIGQS